MAKLRVDILGSAYGGLDIERNETPIMDERTDRIPAELSTACHSWELESIVFS